MYRTFHGFKEIEYDLGKGKFSISVIILFYKRSKQHLGIRIGDRKAVEVCQ